MYDDGSQTVIRRNEVYVSVCFALASLHPNVQCGEKERERCQSVDLTVPSAIFLTIPQLFRTLALGINTILLFSSSNTLFPDIHTHALQSSVPRG